MTAGKRERRARMTDRDVAKIVIEAWRLALGLDDITEANFFELGGNSVTIAHLAQQVESRLNIKFPMRVLFFDGRLGPLIAECQQAVRVGRTPE
jgi:acyl carrier protein